MVERVGMSRCSLCDMGKGAPKICVHCQESIVDYLIRKEFKKKNERHA